PNLTYNWNVSGDGIILGSSTNATISVVAAGSGTYTVTLRLAVFSGPLTTNSTCSLAVRVNPLPPCPITGPSIVCPTSTNTYAGPAGMVAYAWSVTGAGTIFDSAVGPTVNVASGGCNTNFTLSLTVTDTNGCRNTCQTTTAVQDTTPPQITCPPPFIAAETP